jgi:hypothetical protein
LAAHLSGKEGIIFSADAWTLTGIPVAQRKGYYDKFGAAMRALGWERKKRRRAPGSGCDQERAYVKGDESHWWAVVWDQLGHRFVLQRRQVGATVGEEEFPDDLDLTEE